VYLVDAERAGEGVFEGVLGIEIATVARVGLGGEPLGDADGRVAPIMGTIAQAELESLTVVGLEADMESCCL
jgi:hypothetical protein